MRNHCQANSTVSCCTPVSPAAAPSEALDDHDSSLHEYLVVEFVLTLLYTGIRKGGLASKNPETLGLVDPLLPLLVRALHCRHSPSVSLALKCMATLVNLPLPGLKEAAPAAGKAVSGLLKRAPNISHPVAQDSFRLLAGTLNPQAMQYVVLNQLFNCIASRVVPVQSHAESWFARIRWCWLAGPSEQHNMSINICLDMHF